MADTIYLKPGVIGDTGSINNLNINASYLMGIGSDPGGSAYGINHAWIRLPYVPILPGSVIHSAVLTLYSSMTTDPSGVLNFKIYFNDEDDPVCPQNRPEFDNLDLTSGVSWTIYDSWVPMSSAHDTPQLNSILQNIIDRPGWAFGNSLLLVIKDTATVYDYGEAKYAYGWPIPGLGPEVLPTLTITYTPPYYEGDLDEDTVFQVQVVSEVVGANKGQITANFDGPFSYTLPAGFKPFGSGQQAITWDPDNHGADVSLSPNLLTARTNVTTPFNSFDNDTGSVIATVGKSSGKWYWEVTISRDGYCVASEIPDLPQTISIGMANSAVAIEGYLGFNEHSYGYNLPGYKANSGLFEAYGDTLDYGDVVGIALDLENNKVWFAKNGVWQNSGDPVAGTNYAFDELPSQEFFPAGTTAGTGWTAWRINSWGYWQLDRLGRVDGLLTLNLGDTDFAHAPPTGFLPYNLDSETTEKALSENVDLTDAYAAQLTSGEGPVDHEGELTEGFTTDDYAYGELPGDTEDPASVTAADSFTTSAAITVEISVGEMEEGVTLADEISGKAPQKLLEEAVSLSDAISATFDPTNIGLAENLTTDDLIEAPMEGDLDEDVTQSEAVSAITEYPGATAEGVTTSEEITASKDKTEFLIETLGLYGDVGCAWGKAVADTIDVTDALIPAVAVPVEEILALAETLHNNWIGTEAVESSLMLLGQLIIGEIFNETATSTIEITDAVTYLHQMISVISDTVDFGETLATQIEFNPVIAEVVALNGVVAVLANLYNANSETMDLRDTVGFAWFDAVMDTIDITDSPEVLWYCMNALTDSIELTEAALGQFQSHNAITDTIELAATLALNQILTAAVTDTINFGIGVELDGELWECWVLNTNAFHASVYSGYSFNSYAVYNNTAYGCKPDGIYKLSGTQDDGAAFKAGIVLPETRFGSHHYKRFRKAYFGIAGTSPAIKLVNEDGASKTYTIERSKVTPTRGVKGRKWTLSVEGFDSLDFVELVPLILTR